jgi:uncharacterized protein (TIGR03435 family)
MLRLSFVFLAALSAGAQTFEVASIKPTELSPNGMMRITANGGPGTADPGRITYSGVPLESFVTYAFDVKSYQISGPAAAVLSERFDLTAKVPAGATKEEARIMMQNFLAERFGMKFHRDTKEMASYVLTVGSKGSKMKPADAPAPVDPNSPPPPPPPPGALARPKMGADGFPELPAAAGRGGGPMMIMMPGKAKMMCTSCAMARLVDTLSSQLGKPVVDMTGLAGNYAFTLFFEPDFSNMRMVGGGPMPAGGGGGMAIAVKGPGGDGPPSANDAGMDTAPPLLSAIQDQLGLKLEAKKAPVEMIVIDHLEKAPTEN